MKQLISVVALIFILLVVLLTGISILAIWDFLAVDVLSKSFMTIGVLGLVSLVTLTATKFIDGKGESEDLVQRGFQPEQITRGNQMILFTQIRIMTLAVLVGAAVLLGLIGVLAIWEILSGTILYRTLATIAVIGFASFIIVLTCISCENNPQLKKKIGVGGIVGIIILGYFMLSLFSLTGIF